MLLQSPTHTVLAHRSLQTFAPRPNLKRCLATSTRAARKKGDISSVFVSLSGGEAAPLPGRFADQKKRLVAGRENQIQKSWDRLLRKLKDEVNLIEQRGSDIIPSIDFKDIHSSPAVFRDELRKRGVAVIRGVIPEHEARGYKKEIEDYVKTNPGTKGISLMISTPWVQFWYGVLTTFQHFPHTIPRSTSYTGQSPKCAHVPTPTCSRRNASS